MAAQLSAALALFVGAARAAPDAIPTVPIGTIAAQLLAALAES